MARTKTSPDTAPSAAHAAPDPAPAPGTAPAADSPAAAVHAALAANPGSAVAVIADAAGTGKPAARDALLAMEKAGTATRVKGGKPGIPDTWTLAGPRRTAPARRQPGSRAGRPARRRPRRQPGRSRRRRDGRRDRAGRHCRDRRPRAAAPTPRRRAAARAATTPLPRTATRTPSRTSRTTRPRRAATRTTATPRPTRTPRRTPTARPATRRTRPSSRRSTERIDQIKAAADAAELVLTASGDLKTALAGLDEIYEQAAQARRSLKAAIGGRKAPAVRPGGLRDKVLAHLDAHPDKEFTPHEIHKVIDHSSGAIANALDTLVKHGDAEVATEKPRRFRRAAQPAGAAPEAERTARSRTAPNWRVPRDNPPRQPGRQRAAPAPAAGQPQQWFTLRPWVFDVTLAGVLLRATPRPPVPIPVADWARAYGLTRDPGSGQHAISLIGPGPDFSPGYAMTTNPDEPVILATLTGPGGEPAGPLLIDGYALPVTVRSEGCPVTYILAR